MPQGIAAALHTEFRRPSSIRRDDRRTDTCTVALVVVVVCALTATGTQREANSCYLVASGKRCSAVCRPLLRDVRCVSGNVYVACAVVELAVVGSMCTSIWPASIVVCMCRRSACTGTQAHWWCHPLVGGGSQVYRRRAVSCCHVGTQADRSRDV